MNRRESQEKKIMDHLKRGHSLTHLQALRLFGCQRLAARINALNDPRGKHKFATVKRMVVAPGGARVAQYWKGNKNGKRQ